MNVVVGNDSYWTLWIKPEMPKKSMTHLVLKKTQILRIFGSAQIRQIWKILTFHWLTIFLLAEKTDCTIYTISFWLNRTATSCEGLKASPGSATYANHSNKCVNVNTLHPGLLS